MPWVIVPARSSLVKRVDRPVPQHDPAVGINLPDLLELAGRPVAGATRPIALSSASPRRLGSGHISCAVLLRAAVTSLRCQQLICEPLDRMTPGGSRLVDESSFHHRA